MPKEKPIIFKSSLFLNLLKEFNTPLESLILPLELVRANIKNEKIQSELQLIYNNALKFNSLFHQIHSILLIQSNIQPIQLVSCSLSQWLRILVERCRPLAQNRNLDIVLHTSADDNAFWDVDHLYLVFGILIGNAIKYSKDSGEAVQIRHKMLPNYIQIEVQDFGIGIRPEKLPFIFNPDYEGDEAHLRLYQSTSIGLYLVKEIVNLLHLQITVESVVNVGTTFCVKLPIYKNKDEIPYKNYSIDPQPFNAHRFSKNRIYEFETSEIVDVNKLGPLTSDLFIIRCDSEETKTDIFNLLGAKYRKLHVSSAFACVQKATNHIPNCIIYVLSHAFDDDLQALHLLKNHKATSHIPVVVVHRPLEVEDFQKLKKAFPNDCIPEEDLKQLLLPSLDNVFHNLNQFLPEPKDQNGTRSLLPGHEQAFLNKLNAIIDNHLKEEDLNSDFYVNEMYLSRTQLHRKLKALTGMSLSRYVRLYKLKKARVYLEKKTGNVSEAAFAFGFNSVSYFSKCFKEAFGLSPSEW